MFHKIELDDYDKNDNNTCTNNNERFCISSIEFFGAQPLRLVLGTKP
jgi:hypothetical protein